MDIKTLQALAEPNRFKIVELLKKQPRSVNEVAVRLNMRQPQASKHLHTLADAGIVNVESVAQRRIYKLNQKPFMELNDWVKSFHVYWGVKLANLDEFVNLNNTKE